MHNPPKENDTHYIVTNTDGKIESLFSGPREEIVWQMIDGDLDGKMPIMTNIDPTKIVGYDGSVVHCTDSTYNVNIKWGDDEYPVVILDDHHFLFTCYVHENEELTEKEIKEIEESVEDVNKGNFFTHEEVKASLGI